MTNSTPFDPSLYVPRPSTQQIIDHLLNPANGPRHKRSLILHAPPQDGKSWLLKHIQEDQLPNHPQHPVVLFVESKDFKPAFYDPEELFVPIVERLWTVIEQYCTQHLAMANANYLPKPTGNKDEIRNDLSLLVQALDKLNPSPYLIILVDGMEEIIEISEELAQQDLRLRQQKDLLWRFETTCIEPLFKYQNMRVLATCRTNAEIGWRTFLVRPRTETKSLDEFTSIDQQFDRLYTKEVTRPTSPLAMAVTLAQIQSELTYYQWNNPGANECLIKKAFLTGGTLDKAAVEECIDGMLTSPTGQDPLPDADKDYLRQLISRFPHINNGVKVVEVGQALLLNDSARNDFISDLSSRGIAYLTGYLLKIQPAIVALILDWFDKP